MVLKVNNFLFLTTLLSSVCLQNLQAADIETNTARMQAMDKITGKVSEIDVPVNAPVRFGSFSVLVRKCVTKTPEETPENTAFVDVVDDYNNQEPVNIFKGWMFSSSPALSAVEHPIYDVWLLKCYNKDNPSVKTLSEEELRLRDEIKMMRINPKIAQKEEAPEETQTSELDAMIKETIASASKLQEDNLSSLEKIKEDNPSQVVVVTSPEADVNSDNNAPQALFEIKTEQDNTDKTTEEIASQDEISNVDEKPLDTVVFEVEDENGYPEDEFEDVIE